MRVVIWIATAFLLCCYGNCSSLRGSSRKERSLNHGPVPGNATDYPDGFWFGTQNLFCVMGVNAARIRRNAPSRYNLALSHRLIFYRGKVFEWGTGADMYHIGYRPAAYDCKLTWETEPAANSTCSVQMLTGFTESYRKRYGPYNLLTNNCHNYGNRLASLLTSGECKSNEDHLEVYAKHFWKFLTEYANGEDWLPFEWPWQTDDNDEVPLVN